MLKFSRKLDHNQSEKKGKQLDHNQSIRIRREIREEGKATRRDIREEERSEKSLPWWKSLVMIVE